jgi:hypothetical protein
MERPSTSTHSLEGNKVPSSVSQVGIIIKYELLNYFRSRRFFILLTIAATIAGILTAVVAHRSSFPHASQSTYRKASGRPSVNYSNFMPKVGELRELSATVLAVAEAGIRIPELPQEQRLDWIVSDFLDDCDHVLDEPGFVRTDEAAEGLASSRQGLVGRIGGEEGVREDVDVGAQLNANRLDGIHQSKKNVGYSSSAGATLLG